MTPNIVYRLATPEDYNSVLKLLQEHFFPDEPLKILSEPKDPSHGEGLAKFVFNEPAVCFVALCGVKMVGVRLAAPKGPQEEQKLLEMASKNPGTRFSQVLLLLATLERDANVFKRYNVDKALHGEVICVNRDFRGMGIALRLYELSIVRAKELGYPLYTCDCISSYAARLCSKLNMDCVNVCTYADYRDPISNEQVFFPSEHHKSAKTFAIRL